jgi:hypothetical protein
MNATITSRVAQTCQTTLVHLLPDDTHPTVVQLAVTVATKKVALLCEEWAKTHVVQSKLERSNDFCEDDIHPKGFFARRTSVVLGTTVG